MVSSGPSQLSTSTTDRDTLRGRYSATTAASRPQSTTEVTVCPEG